VKGSGELILVNGDTILSLYMLNGTHSGTLAGPGGRSIPATGKPVGYLQAHLLQTDASGRKVAKEEFYSDSGTMMAQLGLSSSPARPVATSAAAAPTVVIAAGTPAELSNVELMRAQMAGYNTHDVKSVDAYYAPDLVYRDLTAPRDLTFTENSAATREFFAAFPDAKLTPLTAWGAGNYVVVAGRFDGTNRGPMPAMGIVRPTGKAVSMRYLDVARWENGKIKEEWLFYDGMAVAGQLGMLKK
jgi:predicted ester cyclase